ncbi:FxsA family protein [Elusimicrobiota bacterium]
MFLKLFLLFVGVPLIEIAILIKMGTVIGFWQTILIQIITGAAGAFLAKLQGMLVWYNIARELQNGRMPAEQLIDGILIFVAGIVLLTPGLLTDAFGFLILIPYTRYWFKRWLRNKFDEVMRSPNAKVTLFFGK